MRQRGVRFVGYAACPAERVSFRLRMANITVKAVPAAIQEAM